MSFNVAFFGYSWTADLRPDAYQKALIDAFREKGANVCFFYSNYMAGSDVLRGLDYRLNRTKLLNDLKSFNPTFVLSMNRGGLDAEMKAAISAPVITWCVDDFSHFFDPDGNGKLDGIVTEKDPVVVSSLELHRILVKAFPNLEKQIYFIPSATDYKKFRSVPATAAQNISFVGSYLQLKLATEFMSRVIKNPELLRGFFRAVDELKRDYRHDFATTLKATGLAQIVEDLGWTPMAAKMEISNILSSRDRFEAVMKTHDLGLHLYGGAGWLTPLMTYDVNSLKAFQGNKSVKTHDDLVRVYQSSKICFNVSQIQTGPALSYRVFDIMASNALLIQPYHPESDAFAIFGKECPIPMYKTFDELRSLCQHYLSHENERSELVNYCNSKMESGFSFLDRVDDLIRISGAKIDLSGSRSKYHVHSTMAHICVEMAPYKSIKKQLHELVMRIVEKLLSPRNRLRMARIFVPNLKL